MMTIFGLAPVDAALTVSLALADQRCHLSSSSGSLWWTCGWLWSYPMALDEPGLSGRSSLPVGSIAPSVRSSVDGCSNVDAPCTHSVSALATRDLTRTCQARGQSSRIA